jgi:hypothetical protein
VESQSPGGGAKLDIGALNDACGDAFYPLGLLSYFSCFHLRSFAFSDVVLHFGTVIQH